MRTHKKTLILLTAVLALLAAACAAPGSDVDDPDVVTDDTDNDDESDNGEDTGEDEAGAENGDDDASSGNGTADGSLVVAQTSDTTTLDPQKQGGMPPMNVLINMFDTLVEMGDDNEPVAGLATEWEAVDDTTWRFELRDDVTFHNGDPFTAEDVQFSLDRLLDPATESPIVELDTVSEVQVVDEYTVDIITEEPDPIIPNKLTLFGGVMLPATYVQDVGDDGFADDPVGTGPFQYVSWERDHQVVMERYDDYWKGAARIEELTFQSIPSTADMLAALRTGEIDIATGLDPSVFTQLEDDDDLTTQVVDGIRMYFVSLNAEADSPLAEREVRQALNYATDVEALTEQVLEGYAEPASTFFPHQTFGFDPGLDPFEYDPELAAELLGDAGYEAGFELTLEARNEYETIVQAMAAQWSEVGIDVTLDIMEAGTFTDRQLAGELGDVHMMGNTGWTLDAVSNAQSYLHSERRYNRWHNDQADELVETGEQSLDSDERQVAYFELQELMQEEAPFVYLYQPSMLYALGPGVDWEGNIRGVLNMYEAQVTD